MVRPPLAVAVRLATVARSGRSRAIAVRQNTAGGQLAQVPGLADPPDLPGSGHKKTGQGINLAGMKLARIGSGWQV